MATIDVSSIEGFADMTAEQKVEALLGVDIPDKVDLSGYIKKDLYDKTASELAEAKKQVKAHMTEDEATKAENEAKWAEMEEKVKQLEREKTESAYKAKYLAMPGFDESLAEETAKAMAAGDMDKVFANHQKANASWEKEIKANMVKQDPKPEGAGGNNNEVPDNVTRAMERGKAKAASISGNNDILNKYTI